jgi:MtrB/PioB family decaheme-associated outer membrane protein
MRTMGTARIILVVLPVLAVARLASAQIPTETPIQAPGEAIVQAPAGATGGTPAQTSDEPPSRLKIGGLNLEGWGEAGLRFLPQSPSGTQAAKFEEYRDINEGLYLSGAFLRFFTPDEKYSFEFGGKDWGLKTQEYHLLGEQLGKWQAGFDWDQMRHIYSTTARTLEAEVRDGVWQLPSQRPPLPSWNDAGFGIDPVGVQWDTAHVFFKISLNPNLDVQADYTRIHKAGDRPIGMAFGSPGSIFLQILQPIDQTIHDFRAQGEWVTEQWQLQFRYTMSIFVEDDQFLRADNPCTPNPIPAGVCPAVGTTASFGTMSLPPSNQAHTFSLAGGINLPLRTRVSGNFSYSRRFQNEDFLQQTYSNSLPASIPSLTQPQKSLGGDVQIAMFNVNVTSRPLPMPVTFTAKYRFFDFMDFSKQPNFEGFLLNDQNAVTPSGPGPEPFRSVRESYIHQNAELSGRWKISEPAALTLGTLWDQWQRSDVREVPTSNEFFAKAALDWTPNDWLLMRATYLPSFRRIDFYHTNAQRVVENNAPSSETGTGNPPIQSYLLRKYDESDRDTQRAELMTQLTPYESLVFTPTLSYEWNNYLDPGFTAGNLLGLQVQTAWSAGMDVTWSPSDRLKVSGGYEYGSNFQKMRARTRLLAAPAPGDTPAADWISDMRDTSNTFRASMTANLIPAKLDLNISGNYEYAVGTVETRNPNVATANNISPSVNANALAQRFPAYTDSLLRLEGALLYHFTKNLTGKLYYVYEQFKQQNWQTDTLNPFVPGVASIYLGNNLQNYTAQIVGATLRYKFE